MKTQANQVFTFQSLWIYAKLSNSNMIGPPPFLLTYSVPTPWSIVTLAFLLFLDPDTLSSSLW